MEEEKWKCVCVCVWGDHWMRGELGGGVGEAKTKQALLKLVAEHTDAAMDAI